MRRLPVIYILLTLAACSVKTLPPQELKAWMEDEKNGLRITKTEGDVTFIAQYKNTDYVLATRGGEIPAGADTDGQVLLFNFFITCRSGTENPLTYMVTSKQEADDRYYHYHFKMVNNLWIESGDIKTPALYCILEKGAGFNNTLAFQIGFEKKNIAGDKDFKLIVDDTILKKGIIKFLFERKNIDRIPKLKN